MPTLFMTDEVELYSELVASEEQFSQMRESLTVEQARQVANLAGTFPAAGSGVVTAMGLAGLSPEDDLAKQIADQSAASLLEDPTEVLQPGQRVNGDALRRQLEDGQRQQSTEGGGEPDSGLSIGELPPLQRVSRAATNVAGALGRGFDIAFEGAAQEVGNVVSSGAQALFDGDDDDFLSEFRENFEGQTSFWRETWNETSRRWGQGMRPWEGRFYEGSEELVGAGLLATSGRFIEDVQQADRQLTLPGRPDVHYTPGRALVQPFVELDVIEPGSRAYQTVSGTLDFANRLLADPLFVAGKVGSAARGLSGAADMSQGLRSADEIASVLPDLRAGLLRGPRRTVNINGVESHISGGTPGGRTLVREMTNTIGRLRDQGLSREQLIGQLRRETGGNLPPDVTVRLAESSTADEVIGVLRDSLNDVRVSSLSMGRRPQAIRRLKSEGLNVAGRQVMGPRPFNNVANQKPLYESNVGEAAEELDRWLGNLELPSADRDELIGRLLAMDVDQTDKVLREQEFTSIMLDAGGAAQRHLLASNPRLAEADANRLTQIMQDVAKGDEESFRRYLTDELGQELPSPGARIRIREGTDSNGREIWNERRLQAGEMPLVTRIGADGIPDVEVIPTARTMTQHASDGIRLPDPAAIRENLSLLGRVGISGSLPVDVVRNMLQPLWVASTLGRPALTVRVVTENQIRMAAHGLHSAFNHPISYLNWVLGNKGSGNLFSQGDDAWRQLEVDHNVMSSFHELRNGRGGKMPGSVHTRDYRLVSRGDPDHTGAWASRFYHFARTDEAQIVASRSREDAIDYLWSGQGVELRTRLNAGSLDGNLDTREAVADYVDAIDMQLTAITGGTIDRTAGQAPRVGQWGNSELYDAIGTGNLRGLNLRSVGGLSDGSKLDRLKKTLDDAEFNEWRPQQVPAPRQGDGWFGASTGERTQQRLNDAFSSFFDFILSRREDSLNRNPAFRQMYWERIGEQAQFLPDNVLDEAISAAEKANLNGGVINNFRNRLPDPFKARDADVLRQLKTARAGNINDPRFADLEALNTYAAAQAAEDMKGLLYDFSNRNNFFDAMNVIMPFGEAWRDILTTWTRLVRNDPARIVRRGQQTVRGGRDSNPLELLPGGSGDASQQGFFYTNDNGEEVFAYPDFGIGLPLAFAGGAIAPAVQGGIGQAAQSAATGLVGATPAGRVGRALQTAAGAAGSAPARVAAGVAAAGFGAAQGVRAGQIDNDNVDVTFTGRMEGLNLVAGQMLPGVGPVVQMPASMLIDPGDDDSTLSRLLLPFGPQTVSEAAMPPWLDKLVDGVRGDPDSDRRLGNITIDVARTLQASGEYTNEAGLMDAESATRLHQDAVAYARQLMFVRGAAQSTLPTGPEMEFRVNDPASENFFTFNSIANEYRERSDEVGPDVALREFIDLFGVDLTSVLQPKTISVRERSLDLAGADWERENPDLVEAYPNTIGFYSPEDDRGGFDFGAYNAQLERGDRETLTPQESLYLSNNRVATAIYYAQRERLGDTANTREGMAFLSELRASLRAEYPGYGQSEGLGGRIDVQGAISEIERAVQDDSLVGNRTVDAIAQYMARRAEVVRAIQSEGLGTGRESLTSSGNERIVAMRNELRQYAEQLALEEPTFAGVWRGVLNRELRNDDDLPSVSENTLPLGRLGLAATATFGGVNIE